MELGCVLAGSALGGMARFLVSRLVGRHAGERFPWGTLAVNASGALALGLLAAALGEGALAASRLGLAAGVGFLGSYTTVSTVSLQTLVLAREGETWRAGANVALSLALCLSAASAGLAAGRWLLAPA